MIANQQYLTEQKTIKTGRIGQKATNIDGPLSSRIKLQRVHSQSDIN